MIKSSLIIVFTSKDYSIINQIIAIIKADEGPITNDITEVMIYDIKNDLLKDTPAKDMEIAEQEIRTILKYPNQKKLYEAILIYLFEKNFKYTSFDWKLLEINILFNQLFNNKINKINFIDNINDLLDDLIIPDVLNFENEKDILNGMHDFYRNKNNINKILNSEELCSILENMEKKLKNKFLFICNMNIILLNGKKNKIKNETKKKNLSIEKIDNLEIKEVKIVNKQYKKEQIDLYKLNGKVKKVIKLKNKNFLLWGEKEFLIFNGNMEIISKYKISLIELIELYSGNLLSKIKETNEILLINIKTLNSVKVFLPYSENAKLICETNDGKIFLKNDYYIYIYIKNKIYNSYELIHCINEYGKGIYKVNKNSIIIFGIDYMLHFSLEDFKLIKTLENKDGNENALNYNKNIGFIYGSMNVKIIDRKSVEIIYLIKFDYMIFQLFIKNDMIFTLRKEVKQFSTVFNSISRMNIGYIYKYKFNIGKNIEKFNICERIQRIKDIIEINNKIYACTDKSFYLLED